MDNRPFEVGDMVVLTTKEKGIVFSINNWGHFPVKIRLNDRVLSVMPDGTTGTLGRQFIKTIRTPRKGSKEARDIVAILLSNARDAKKNYNLAFNKDVKSIYTMSHDVIMRLYEKAKSMPSGTKFPEPSSTEPCMEAVTVEPDLREL